MDSVSRRAMLAVAAAGSLASAASAANAASFGNPDEPPQGEINTQDHPSSVTDPGPQNPAISSQFPGAFSPPATDVGDMPMFWASFNNAPRRIQDGGWARQVTQADFQIADGDFRRQYAADRGRHPRTALAPGGGMGLCHQRRGAASPRSTPKAAPMSRTSMKAGSGISPPACRIPCRASATDGARIHFRIRQRNADRIQHAALERMDRAHAARHFGAEFQPAGRDVCENPADAALYIPRKNAGAAG